MQSVIDGKFLRQMLISAANNLINKKQLVDDMNVFPVPDGDTGTNMSLTIGAVKKALIDNEDDSCEVIADIAANASLRGARGNSGVILSQFLRGISKGLKGQKTADIDVIKNAMRLSKESAYRAVMKPKEGTILTVAREMVEAIDEYSADNDIKTFFAYIVEKGNISLDNTPELLPVLKQANVVDSGGKGLMTLLEGALYYIENEEIVPADMEEKPSEQTEKGSISQEDIKFGYCTEFIIVKNSKKEPWKKLRTKLEYIGDCVIVIDDKDIIKVHVHSNNPGIVLEEALKLGSLSDIKIDNLREQAAQEAEHGKKAEETEHYKNAFITVAAGDGITNMFKELGCQSVINGGQTMNPSTDDFINEIEKLDADNIFIFPNNKNIIMAAEQAKDMSAKNITVIPTKTIVQGITAMIAFDEELDAKENETNFNDAASCITSASVTFAARDCELDGFTIKQGNIMGLVEGKIKAVGTELNDVCSEIISSIANEDSTISLYKGKDVTQEQADALQSILEEKYPDGDINIYDGGQPLYYYYIAIE